MHKERAQPANSHSPNCLARWLAIWVGLNSTGGAFLEEFRLQAAFGKKVRAWSQHKQGDPISCRFPIASRSGLEIRSLIHTALPKAAQNFVRFSYWRFAPLPTRTKAAPPPQVAHPRHRDFTLTLLRRVGYDLQAVLEGWGISLSRSASQGRLRPEMLGPANMRYGCGGFTDDPYAMAATLRRWIVEQLFASRVGHIGSALSVTEIVAALWIAVMRQPGTTLRDRDRFILSKGHAALALYAAMRWKGSI